MDERRDSGEYYPGGRSRGDAPTPAPAAVVDDAVTRTSANPVKSSGVWSAIWGALAALPAGFASLYDWCVAQLAGKADKSEMSVTTANDTATITLKTGTSATVITQHQPLPAAVAPSTSAAQGAYADARDTGTALAGKQSTITASGILKGDGSGGVTTAVAGTDYQAPLTTDATPTANSTNPVQSGGVYTALAGKVGGAYGSGGWTITNGARTYSFASDQLVDNITVALVGDLRYAINELATPAGAATLADRAVNLYVGDSTFSSCTFTLPDEQTDMVRDFLLDVDNSGNANAVDLEFYNLGTDFALICDEDSTVADLTTVEAGARARFYFTETALTSNNLPVISVQRITLGTPTTSISRS